MSELTKYQSDQLVAVERIIGKMSKLRKEGRCDSKMAGELDHLIEEVLFLRQVLSSHPPALTAARLRAIIGNRE